MFWEFLTMMWFLLSICLFIMSGMCESTEGTVLGFINLAGSAAVLFFVL